MVVSLHFLGKFSNAAGVFAKAAILGLALFAAACNSPKQQVSGAKAELDTAPKFSEAEMQVKESPRVTELKEVPQGGGRYQVGKPYKVRGKWYKPKEDPSYAATGKASWYGPNFHGRLTANGEIYNQYGISAAHPTMPLPSYARVTNIENGSSVIVRVNDRGPYAHGRIIDVSGKAAELLDFRHQGVANVKVEYVGKARLDGQDEKFLLASYRAPGMPAFEPGTTQPGTMIAMAEETADPVAAAIDGAALPGDPALGFIPIPTPRPDYLPDGTPLLMAAKRQLVLGYSSQSQLDQRFALAFEAVVNDRGLARETEKIDPQMAATSAIILIGRFADADAAVFARQSLTDVGLVSAHIASENGEEFVELTMLTGADAVDAALAIARERGFTTARRISAR
jgi:rare lipoprotein A